MALPVIVLGKAATSFNTRKPNCFDRFFNSSAVIVWEVSFDYKPIGNRQLEIGNLIISYT